MVTRMHCSRMCTTHSSSHRGGGVCLSTCWDTHPQAWAWRHPLLGVGLDTHTHPWVWAWRPTPLGVGLETPQCGPGDPQVWDWRPPRCGPGDPPKPDPSTSPLGVGLVTYKAYPPETCKVCWYPTPPPCGQNS